MYASHVNTTCDSLVRCLLAPEQLTEAAALILLSVSQFGGAHREHSESDRRKSADRSDQARLQQKYFCTITTFAGLTGLLSQEKEIGQFEAALLNIGPVS
ncbi:hypothetical protein L5515_007370 [Caenorhabditis briggsae]|uniref:Uncharacterized protein n=1 Tax=Caenorhabditis briggsae TaxID=6238 RepID=A0AAE9F4E2_CAEBR|nr:hypothetical protein L3Y34_007522 [Caenorhabditis briggsae]UMM34188.1 hypothetical protein L5515_007370 [Caenorhabditis briggsae]